jgi:tRNA threonylcarbamoyladenosine biosynthesis protein TsaB
MLLLGIDTCGPTGSVALGRLTSMGTVMRTVDVIDQAQLEGRTYSSTLVTAIDSLLKANQVHLRDIGCIVVVNGPGSFTGVRVGLSTAKGLAHGADLPVVAVSRLEVLARKAGVLSAALDAHRHEVFLRVAEGGTPVRELLAGGSELASVPPPSRIAVCDAAGDLLHTAWPRTRVVTVPSPTASDAMPLAASRIAAGEFVDPGVLDGHYLRRSDAEIFGAPARAVTPPE